ncbi:hypothetical protein KCU81_g248, partial [Aureobasidium melanogenum]
MAYARAGWATCSAVRTGTCGWLSVRTSYRLSYKPSRLSPDSRSANILSNSLKTSSESAPSTITSASGAARRGNSFNKRLCLLCLRELYCEASRRYVVRASALRVGRSAIGVSMSVSSNECVKTIEKLLSKYPLSLE